MGGMIPPGMGMGPQMGAGPGGASAVYDWLKKMAMQRAMGGSPYAGQGAPLGGAQAYAGAPAAPAAPVAAPPAAPTPGPGQISGFGLPAGPLAAQPDWRESFKVPGPSPSPGISSPQTKTEPRTPLQFSWGGADPQNYQPGITDVLSMEGAPSVRQGLAGAEPADPSRGGGFIASQPWENVANPQAFAGFREAPMVDETLRGLEDPMWRERAQADITSAAELETGKGMLREQATILREESERVRREVMRLYEAALAEREREKGAPLDDIEQQTLYGVIASQYMGPQAGSGGGSMQIR